MSVNYNIKLSHIVLCEYFIVALKIKCWHINESTMLNLDEIPLAAPFVWQQMLPRPCIYYGYLDEIPLAASFDSQLWCYDCYFVSNWIYLYIYYIRVRLRWKQKIESHHGTSIKASSLFLRCITNKSNNNKIREEESINNRHWCEPTA